MPSSRGQFAPGQSGNPAGQFPPGVSGNPSGRPKGTAGIAARVREHCGEDYGKLVDAWMCLAFGSAAERRAFFGETVNVTAKDRLFALAELRDTSIGRPKQTLEHEASGEKPLPKLMIVVQPAPGRPPIEPRTLTALPRADYKRPINERGSDGVAVPLDSDSIPDFSTGRRHRMAREPRALTALPRHAD